MTAVGRSWLSVTPTPVEDGCVLLTVDGELDSTTYLSLRDAVIKAALDGPRAVLVDVTMLQVPAPSAWAVFTSARWHIDQWLDVPIALVCADGPRRNFVWRNGITRYVPIYRTVETACAELPSPGKHRYRRRARAELPAQVASARRCRELTAEWLTDWSKTDFISVVKVVVTVFAENALTHTDSDFGIRMESDGDTVTVAVEDHSSAEAIRHEPTGSRCGVSGLDLVAALCRTWGNAPTASGKIVWAVIGPENL